MAEPLAPGATVGILGSGQLGRMLAVAAAQMGLRAHIYAPDAPGPAGEVSAAWTRGAYDDAGALTAFGRAVDVVTYEFENVPAAALDALEPVVTVRPGRRALATAQDRLTEKTFLEGAGAEVAPFAAVDDAASLAAALARIGAPAILKTRRLGYDGKGQARIKSDADADAEAALAAMAGAPAILEGFVDFRAEVSVIAARGADGAFAAYDPGENIHREGILRRTTVPAALSDAEAEAAVDVARAVAEALDYVGVLGVELFVARDGCIIVNEIAPRVHNTGHWTIEGCAVNQFHQQIRAVAGWPLGDPARHADAVMDNLIGDEAHDWREIAARPGAALHLYGKGEARPGRKMGHVTTTRPVGTRPRS